MRLSLHGYVYAENLGVIGKERDMNPIDEVDNSVDKALVEGENTH